MERVKIRVCDRRGVEWIAATVIGSARYGEESFYRMHVQADDGRVFNGVHPTSVKPIPVLRQKCPACFGLGQVDGGYTEYRTLIEARCTACAGRGYIVTEALEEVA